MADILLLVAKPFASLVAFIYQSWRRVRVTVHRAYMQGNPQQLFFVTVTNLSRNREVEIVRVWFTSVPSVEVLAQPLPRRLKTDESWATWVSVDAIDAIDLPYAESRFRVRLSSGKDVPSRANPDPAPVGYIPGVR
jgi:hypothetical protein